LTRIPSHLSGGSGVGTLISVRDGRLILLLFLWMNKLNFGKNTTLENIADK